MRVTVTDAPRDLISVNAPTDASHDLRTLTALPTTTTLKTTTTTKRYNYMSDPSVAVAEAFKQFSQATVSAVGRDTFLSDPSFTHFSFALTNKGRVRG